MGKKVVWIVPEFKGGIRTYCENLWPNVEKACHDVAFETLAPVFNDDREIYKALSNPDSELSLTLKNFSPDLIHLHHEFTFFGKKAPGLHRFFRFHNKLRQNFPDAKIVATAHSVLDPSYKFSVKWRGLQTPLRWLANVFLIPSVRSLWLQKTWSQFEGAIVHSRHLSPIVENSGCGNVEVIPLASPRWQRQELKNDYLEGIPNLKPLVVVFGFLSAEKGQDVAIQAFANLKTDANLVLAGNVRRPSDQPYADYCRDLANKLGISSKVFFPGFVPADQVDGIFERATLVLAPFRETWGSASLVQALVRGKSTLTSDLLLNLELNERVNGCLAFFKAGDFVDCAQKIDQLLNSPSSRQSLGQAATEYAHFTSPEKIGQKHADFYKSFTR